MAVSSSVMTDADYDPAARELTIRFVHGGRYTYCGVPAGVFEALLAAPSKGRYFHEAIRNRFDFTR